MNIMTDDIEMLASLDMMPSIKEIPRHDWAQNALPGFLLQPAFDLAADPEQADLHFRRLVVHWLWFRHPRDPQKGSKLSLCDAIKEVRAALWFYALAKDLGNGELYQLPPEAQKHYPDRNTHPNWRSVLGWVMAGISVERTAHRDLVARVYGCVNPVKPPEPKAEAKRQASRKTAGHSKQQVGLF